MADTVRFVHAADLHLDAPFKGINAADARVRDALVASTFTALDTLVEACVVHRAGFLVLAGDIYNVGDASLKAQFAFRDACERLVGSGVKVYLARGNHDPASATRHVSLPDGVHVFSAAEAELVHFEGDGGTCSLYGRSFASAAERANLAALFQRQPSDRLAVGVLHANVGGRQGHEPYAPCSLEDLRRASMDYWALGHIHKPEVLDDRGAIAYAGCAQGLNPNESGLRGCRMVTLAPDSLSATFVPTCSVVWEQGAVDVSRADDADGLLTALAAEANKVAAEAEGRPVVLRVTLEGRGRVHGLLGRTGFLDDVRAELNASLLERDQWVWIDRVTDRTRPALDLDAVRAGEDLPGDLARLADVLGADQAAATAFVEDAASYLRAKVDARDMPEIEASAVLERARDLVLDRLLAPGDR